ncbi:hypothetical protein IAI10_14910 [Clostridium sp. 19966]|uniref:hypothetical protein n=1 Tax=Clostridium sp. 19966 TaxID=2768166 RepID=UPI0028DE22A8|nr:hypothetical protein [Clostridium sp. 19966]MDT8717953.1 hypothetical protein [Clostridium sp. 19966]
MLKALKKSGVLVGTLVIFIACTSSVKSGVYAKQKNNNIKVSVNKLSDDKVKDTAIKSDQKESSQEEKIVYIKPAQNKDLVKVNLNDPKSCIVEVAPNVRINFKTHKFVDANGNPLPTSYSRTYVDFSKNQH